MLDNFITPVEDKEGAGRELLGYCACCPIRTGIQIPASTCQAGCCKMPVTLASKHPMPSIDMLIHKEMGTSPKQTHK